MSDSDPPELTAMVRHKASRECPMTGPHPSAICGIVAARRRAQAAADARGNDPDDPDRPPPLPPAA